MRVGTRRQHSNKNRYSRDHPHACGDKQNMPVRNGKIIGSSPCVWGQVICNFYIACGYGIIPMRVGTSSDSDSTQHTVEDHPHACGDKLIDCQILDYCVGSSPCVWGQVNNVPLEYEYTGIIPMRVGTRFGRQILYSVL